MLPAINRSVGKNIGFPDVCLTPAGPAVIPVPYPNIGMHAMSIGFSPNVMLTGTPALNLASMIPITMGDEGGVANPMIKQMGRFMVGNPIVHVNLLPGINLTCLTTGNNMNNALGAVLAPGISNVYYTFRTGTADSPSSAEPGGSDIGLANGLDSGVAGGLDSGVAGGLDSGVAGGLDSGVAGGLDRGVPAEIAALLRELASAGREEGPPVVASLAAPGVGVVAIRVFSADVPARVHCAVRALSADDVAILVIDLRGNPGGELNAFLELAGDFLPAGAEICTVVDAGGDETAYHAPGEASYTVPLILLVDGATASAAELFAGCLSAHGRALVLGGPMFGKDTGYRFAAGPAGETSRVGDIRVRLPTPTFD